MFILAGVVLLVPIFVIGCLITAFNGWWDNRNNPTYEFRGKPYRARHEGDTPALREVNEFIRERKRTRTRFDTEPVVTSQAEQDAVYALVLETNARNLINQETGRRAPAPRPQTFTGVAREEWSNFNGVQKVGAGLFAFHAARALNPFDRR